jgi:acyl-CoA hydrolase
VVEVDRTAVAIIDSALFDHPRRVKLAAVLQLDNVIISGTDPREDGRLLLALSVTGLADSVWQHWLVGRYGPGGRTDE